MTDYRTTIYNKLSEITTANVYQSRPEVIDPLPAITFDIQSNVPKYNLSNEIVIQDIIVKVDIWADTSGEAETLLNSVESKMRELKFRLTSNLDVPDPDGICHLATQFTY